jgi:hypothetical protein
MYNILIIVLDSQPVLVSAPSVSILFAPVAATASSVLYVSTLVTSHGVLRPSPARPVSLASYTIHV